MSEGVIVALIGLAGSAVGSLLGIFVSQKLTQYRLEQLEKKMDDHGAQFMALSQRIGDLEKHNIVQDGQIQEVTHRLDSLERSET